MATLQRRARLRPILDLAKDQGCTYRWGYPLAVIFRKASSSFTLRTPADLLDLFSFLDVEPIQIPNWRQPISRNGQSAGTLGPTEFPFNSTAETTTEAPSGDQSR